ncbi:MAG: GGDEF domain-containing phosphodiesterase [Oscillospiraceae bacterium]|nr:GGDEF domain-containing phosphodiesterase [Oscillospiraceae bacterium]
MKGKLKGKKRLINDPSVRIIMITFVSALAAVGGLLFLSINQSSVSGNYNRIVNYEVSNKEYISKISENISQHQAVLFQYIANRSDTARKNELKEKAEEIHQTAISYLNRFHDNVTGTEYEPYYHTIYSDLNGYFSNIDNVYYFTENGDMKTANFYLETSLAGYIDKVNAEIKKLDTIIEDDLEDSEITMEIRIDIAETSALVLILILILFSVYTISACSRIADHMLNKDPLTLVDNYEKIRKDCSRFTAQKKLQDYTCVFSNIKDFKFYNQNYGSKTGDAILSGYASEINKFINKDERVGRNGGDNFIILIRKGREEKLISFLSDIELDIETDELKKTISVGSRCGIYKTRENDDTGTMLNACNMALSAARMSGASDFVWYEEKMLQDIAKKKEILSQCTDGLKNGEFLVYYQPKVNMETNSLCGCEALVRWLHNNELISPGTFIPVLESEGKITDLDFYVFRKVCSDIRNWREKGINPVRVSSNFSKTHLRNPDFADRIIQIINEFEINPELIEIELTESSAYDNLKSLTDFVEKMKEHSIFTSMDDFGTGYSSLSLLKDLNVDVIKIDKSFIDDIDKGDRDHEKMVENVVHMIHDLHRNVICEGVETEKQAEFLKSISCRTAQGYLYDKPLTHDEFEKRLVSPVYTKQLSQ